MGDGHLYLLGNNQVIILLPLIAMGVAGIGVNSWHVLNTKLRSKAELLMLRKIKEIERQKRQYEQLLVSALSRPVVDKLQKDGEFPPEMKDATIIACDIISFSKHCEVMPANIVVKELVRFFAKFDSCCQKFHVEPLRSQGDSRIAVAGLQRFDKNKKERCPQIDAIMAMLEFTSWLRKNDSDRSAKDHVIWNARIGIHTGPVIMGVIQSARLSFDVWGDTVNIAARLEQVADENQIMVSETLLWATKGIFSHSILKPFESKNTHIKSAATILGIDPRYIDEQGCPNETFSSTYDSDDIIVVSPRNVAT